MKKLVMGVLAVMTFGVLSNCSSAKDVARDETAAGSVDSVDSTQQAVCDGQACDEACSAAGAECSRCTTNGVCFCRPFCGPPGHDSAGGAICTISWSGWGSWICGNNIIFDRSRPAN